MKAYAFSILIVVLKLEDVKGNFISNATLAPSCKQIGPFRNLSMIWAMDIFGGKEFFLPVGSQSAYEDLSELLGGERHKSAEDLDKMCLHLNVKGFSSTLLGYDARFLKMDCALVTKGVQDCKPNPKTEFPERHQAAASIQTVAWSDNKQLILMVRCNAEGDKNDWLVYSTQPNITEKSLQDIKQQVLTMGFTYDEHSVHRTKYDSCKFQNTTKTSEEE